VFVEGLIGSIYLDRPEDLKRYHDIFRRLQSIALSPEDTAGWIADLGHSYADIDISQQRKGTGEPDAPT
jgi:Domain of unknown function (DUF5753)